MGFRVARRGKPLATMGSGLQPSRGQLERPEDHRAWLNRADNLKRTMQAQSPALSLLFITTEQLYDLNIFIPAVVRNAPKFFIPGDTLFLVTVNGPRRRTYLCLNAGSLAPCQ